MSATRNSLLGFALLFLTRCGGGSGRDDLGVGPIDASARDFTADLARGTICFVVDEPLPGCVCDPWWRDGVGATCASGGTECTVIQDQSFFPLFQCEVRCNAQGQVECVSGPCECLVDPNRCAIDMNAPDLSTAPDLEESLDAIAGDASAADLRGACVVDGQPCFGPQQCCSAQCNLGSCGCLANGSVGCFANAQCCSNKCANGSCQP